MSQQLLFSVIESRFHPRFSDLYARLGIKEVQLNSIRKTINKLKKDQPDFVVAEFFYGYSNNYAGVNISNLDVLLVSLRKYSDKTKLIVLVDKKEIQYVDKLTEIYPLYAVIPQPAREFEMESVLQV